MPSIGIAVARDYAAIAIAAEGLEKLDINRLSRERDQSTDPSFDCPMVLRSFLESNLDLLPLLVKRSRRCPRRLTVRSSDFQVRSLKGVAEIETCTHSNGQRRLGKRERVRTRPYRPGRMTVSLDK